MTNHKPSKPGEPANRIRAIDRKRFTREEVEAAIQRRRNYGIYYDTNR